MTQINIRVDAEFDELFEYLAEGRKKPKAMLVKEILYDQLVERILPQLLLDYQEGKIGIKKILRMTRIPASELLKKITNSGIECPITPEIDDYTNNHTDQIINRYRNSESE
jgi:hypothetical protein